MRVEVWRSGGVDGGGQLGDGSTDDKNTLAMVIGTWDTELGNKPWVEGWRGRE